MENTIINGVDVSGCELLVKNMYCKENCSNQPCSILAQKRCIQKKNCYYKQSSRKDERIRELEQKLSQIANMAIEINNISYGRVNILARQIKQIAQGE